MQPFMSEAIQICQQKPAHGSIFSAKDNLRGGLSGTSSALETHVLAHKFRISKLRSGIVPSYAGLVLTTSLSKASTAFIYGSFVPG